MNGSTANKNLKKSDQLYRKMQPFWYRLVLTLFRHSINKFSKSVLLAAHEHGFINSSILHEMAAIIDRRLWPKREFKPEPSKHYPGCPSLSGEPVYTCGGGRHA